MVILEEVICESLGLVRGCRCIVDDIIPHELETPREGANIGEPFVFNYMPRALLLRCPKTPWIKEDCLKPGQFLLKPIRKTWGFKLERNDNVLSRLDKTQNHFLDVERLQLAVANADVMLACTL